LDEVATKTGTPRRKTVAVCPPAADAAHTPARSETQLEWAPKEQTAMRSVGLDLGSRKIAYCIVDKGRITARGTVGGLDELAGVLGPDTPPAQVAFEACREAWHVHATVSDWGKTALLIDTTRVRRIGVGQHGRKTDRLDAEAIAWAVERDQIPLAHLLSPQRQQLRVELLTRRGLVETRSQMITTVRGIVRGQGLRIAPCDAERFLDKVQAAKLPQTVQVLIDPLLAVVLVAHRQLCTLDERIETLCASEPAIRKLATVPGVGLLVAAMFVSVIDQAKRFRNARHVASYLGLVPLEKSSGLPGQRLGAITKHGNSYMRALLVQAAWVLLRTAPATDPLARWGRELVKRRGKRIAAVAVARRLACVMWALWKRDVAYDPEHVAELSARGLERSAEVIASQALALQRQATRASERSSFLKRRRTAAVRWEATMP
jgi:transposase